MFHQQHRYEHEHCVLFQLHVMIPHMSRGTIHFKMSNLFNKYENKTRDCLGVPGTLWIVMRKKKPWVMVTSKNKSSLLFLLLLDILPRSHPLSISPFYFDPFRSQCFSMGIHLQTKKQSTAKYQSIFLENFLWVGPMVQCHKVQFLSIISWILLIFSDSSDSVSSTAIQSTCRRRSLARSLIASAAISAKHRASALCEGTSQIMRHRGSIEIDNFCTINLWKHIA